MQRVRNLSILLFALAVFAAKSVPVAANSLTYCSASCSTDPSCCLVATVFNCSEYCMECYQGSGEVGAECSVEIWSHEYQEWETLYGNECQCESENLD